jgi:hypothetical protein
LETVAGSSLSRSFSLTILEDVAFFSTFVADDRFSFPSGKLLTLREKGFPFFTVVYPFQGNIWVTGLEIVGFELLHTSNDIIKIFFEELFSLFLLPAFIVGFRKVTVPFFFHFLMRRFGSKVALEDGPGNFFFGRIWFILSGSLLRKQCKVLVGPLV